LPFWLIILFGGAFEMLLGIQPEVIAMKTDQSLIQQLAQLAQVTAIVGGGIGAMQEQLTETKDGYVLALAVPSLGPDAYRIQVKDNVLLVYTTISATSQVDSEAESTIAPTLVRTFPLPHFIDPSRIQARFEDGALNIFGPFNQLVKNFEKDIDIQHF
jgi:HSP20 family molecular chaperone IbpA